MAIYHSKPNLVLPTIYCVKGVITMSKPSETKQQINEILQEYFSEDVGGGWSISSFSTKTEGGKTVFNIGVKFFLSYDRQDGEDVPTISVSFPIRIKDGAPRPEWETELRELLDKVSREFTGDVEQTLIKLEEIMQATYEDKPHGNRRTMEEFKEQVEEMDLWRYRRYAAAVTWDDWERMQMEQEIKNNQQKQ